VKSLPKEQEKDEDADSTYSDSYEGWVTKKPIQYERKVIEIPFFRSEEEEEEEEEDSRTVEYDIEETTNEEETRPPSLVSSPSPK
jgi:hypothetical protein